ncbi:MAG: PQQ-binding-like beta-propeller repeat protein [Planctomycetes bacterium]|nr:PQQ-binding-like beta-propeller repeat protein [Planctomycetota bacterium]
MNPASTAAFLCIVACAAGLAGAPPEQGSASRPPVRGIVFNDKNRDGVRDEGEPGIANIEVTNGKDFVKTAADGTFGIEPGRDDYISVVRPADRSSTGPWFCNIKNAGGGTIAFGLASDAPTGDPRKLVHISGMKLETPNDIKNALEIAGELSNLASRPVCAISTGAAGAEFAKFKKNSPIEIDALESGGGAPDRFVIDRGLFRIVFVNKDGPNDNFIKNAFANLPVYKGAVIVFDDESGWNFCGELNTLTQRGILLFEAPYCSLRGANPVDAVPESKSAGSKPHGLAASIGPLLVAGADGSPRSYRIVNLISTDETTPSTVETQARHLLAHRRVSFVWPQAGSSVPPAEIDVRVNAYDSYQNAVEGKYTIQDSAGNSISKALKFDGGTLWRARVGASQLAEGRAESVATFKDDKGFEWEVRNLFEITTKAPKPKFNGEFGIVTDVAPPLRLDWSLNLDLPICYTPFIDYDWNARGDLESFRDSHEYIHFEGCDGTGVQFERLVDPKNGASRDINKKDTRSLFFPLYRNRLEQRVLAKDLGLSNIGYATFTIRDQTLVSSVKSDNSSKPDERIELWSIPNLKSCNFLLQDMGHDDSHDYRIYCIIDSKLTCISPTTGTQIWQSVQKLGDAGGGVFRTNDGLVAATGADSTIQAFDMKTGAWRWKWEGAAAALDASVPGQPLGRQIGGTPVVSGNYCYFGANDGRVYAVDLRTGVTVWWFRLGAPVALSPVLYGNSLFIVAGDGHLHAFCP